MAVINEVEYFGFRKTIGDTSRVRAVPGWVPALLLPTGARDFHIASAADYATDWNVANPTHPTVSVHSETTPATDYISLSHNGTSGIINVEGGTLALQVAGTTVLLLDSGVLTFDQDIFLNSGDGLNVGSTARSTTSDGDGATDLIAEGQFHGIGTAFAGGAVLIATYNATNTRAVAPHLVLLKGAAATQVATTGVADNEVLGVIGFAGSDAADFESYAAAIQGVVDSTTDPVTAGIMGGSLEFYTTANGGETLTLVATMNNAQNILVGSGTSLTISDGDGAADLIPGLQIMGLTAARGTIVVATFNTTNTRAVAPHLALVKGAAATQVATTAVADNEVIGSIVSYVSDGTDFETPAASIEFVVDDATPAAGQVGGSIEFYTSPVNSETLTLFGAIASDQNLYVGNNNGVVIGYTAQITLNALVPEFQVAGTVVGADGAMAVVLYSATAGEGPEIVLARSKSATLGTNTIVASGDSLGRIVFAGADGGTDFDLAAAIVAEVAATPGVTTDMPGRLLFQTSPDATSTPATRMTILSGATTVAQAQLGTAGTSTGALLFGGVTSGVVTLTVAAAAGTWSLVLPAATGAGAGQQLTDTNGDGVTAWAAASLGEWKNDLGILDPHEALAAVVKAPTHKFTYNKDVLPLGQSDGNGYEFTGIFAEEAPWAMYGKRDGLRSGIAFSDINAFGYARAAIQALYEDLQDALGEITGLRSELAALKS